MLGLILSIFLSQWTILAALAVWFLYRRSIASFQFFSERGVAFEKPWPYFGNFGKMMLQRESMFDLVVNSYHKHKGKRFYGLYDMSRPLLTIRDPELIRQITVKDFDHFVDHRPFFSDQQVDNLFSRSLFLLSGQRWRDMRATLSPAFTGSKMRQMFQLVVDCADQATTILRTEALATAEPYVPEMKDLFTRITNDVIATAAFGISVNSLEDRDNEFYLMGKRTSNFSSFKNVLKIMAISMMPSVARAVGISLEDREQKAFYHSLVHDTIAYREREGLLRPDMIHLLMEARKGQLKASGTAAAAAAAAAAQTVATDVGADDAGFATVDEVQDDALKGEQKVRWEDDDLTAQCFLFFLAGFDTSATLLCFAAHELMENAAVQRRLIEELDEAKRQLAGKPLTYDSLQKLKYLDMVVSESLRKWPPAIAMDRQCQKTYQLTDETGHVVQLEKGDGVWIPAVAIHRDPQYYANPDSFDPERFNDERRADIAPFTYMPFGNGPRNCIGSRFALMECKAILYHLLTNFTFEVAATSTVPLVLEASSFTLKAMNGFNIHLKPRH